jgi:adenosine deaminase
VRTSWLKLRRIGDSADLRRAGGGEHVPARRPSEKDRRPLSIDGNERPQAGLGLASRRLFRKAGAAGLKRTVHAGESSGPEGVRDAIELLGADRIDHGVRAIEDDSVVALLAEHGIPLGVCPTSNIALKVYSTMEAHPTRPASRRWGAGFDQPDD